LILESVAANRRMFPYNPATDDELYDYFLRNLVYTTYPLVEPIMLENPFKSEGVYRMVKGAKNWRALDGVRHFPAGKLHLMSGEKDSFVPLAIQQAFWQAVPSASRASFIVLKNTEHKLPEIYPALTAAWILEIAKDNPDIGVGRVFDGDPIKGEARSGSIVIPLQKESFCETILRKAFRPF
jgi:pimeloyl-ACP methyl ester carboxylesterase